MWTFCGNQKIADLCSQKNYIEFHVWYVVDIDGTKANADDDCLGEESIEEISDYLLAKEIVEEKLDELEEV